MNILPIGDSITQGGRAGVKEYTYRWPLARMLSDEGVCYNFIGSRSAGLDPAAEWPSHWDANHESYYGATTDYVRDQLAAHMEHLPPPDIALVDLGTNDQETDTVKSLREIVIMLRKANPRVSVLIAQIPVSLVRGAVLHYRVHRLSAELSTAESNVVAVDQFTYWDPKLDTFDGVHPNLRGQRKMAERWLEAMGPYLHDTTCGERSTAGDGKQ